VARVSERQPMQLFVQLKVDSLPEAARDTLGIGVTGAQKRITGSLLRLISVTPSLGNGSFIPFLCEYLKRNTYLQRHFFLTSPID